ncbi:MAG: hypothetical protein EZS28_035831 [Streblomastix strix]|uniref:Uncharacterized protein n=1 Tax=Streblomastix strix TaxID=222440 RepID=A0A5J4UEU3_9EUKA|nr:MAG: hypothetical protein EZS28_035831 [Streblomastix strix]
MQLNHFVVFVIDNSQKYEYNPNARLDQRSMDLGSRRPVITEEQQRNEIMNDGSQKQKKNQQLNQSFPIESQEDLTQNAVFERDAPETTIAQERLEELRQQKLQSDLIASENLNTVYDISALDWGRPPVNEIYGRSPFVTHKTVYKYDQFGNPQAYIKTDNQTAGKIGVKDKDKGKMKKNYVPTSQLIAISSVQENLVKKFRKTNKKQKKK